MKSLAIAVLATASLCACTTAGTSMQTDITTAKAELSRAVEAYGIARGIAGVAVAANPSLTAPVARMESVIDPLIPAAQTLIAASDVSTLQVAQLVEQIQAEIVAIETATAPQIKVVANG
jgi:hypothetical protein